MIQPISAQYTIDKFIHPGAGYEIERNILEQYTLNGKIVKGKEIPKQKPISPLTYNDIHRKLKNLTDIQWYEYIKTIIGKRIKWKAKLVDVIEDGIFTTKYVAKLDPNIDYPSISFKLNKKEAMQLNKNEWITFEGEIKFVRESLLVGNNTLVVVLVNAKIIN